MQCPVDIPRNWRKQPKGFYNYSEYKRPVVYNCDIDTRVCSIHMDNYQIMLKNFAQCEKTREDMIEFFDIISQDASMPSVEQKMNPITLENNFLKESDIRKKESELKDEFGF